MVDDHLRPQTRGPLSNAEPTTQGNQRRKAAFKDQLKHTKSKLSPKEHLHVLKKRTPLRRSKTNSFTIPTPLATAKNLQAPPPQWTPMKGNIPKKRGTQEISFQPSQSPNAKDPKKRGHAVPCSMKNQVCLKAELSKHHGFAP